MIADPVPKYVITIYCKFADDLTTLIISIYPSHACHEIDHLKEWSSINKFFINLRKTN
jgi:hypothetical protein